MKLFETNRIEYKHKQIDDFGIDLLVNFGSTFLQFQSVVEPNQSSTKNLIQS